MLDENIKNRVLDILNNLPKIGSEGPCLELKNGYPKNKQAELIKDVCGFLNSVDGLGRDKFIIVGIEEDKNHHYKLGSLIPELWFKDDNEIQNLIDKISPRPSVISDIIINPNNGLEYAYLYIPGEVNNDLVYSINADYPSNIKQSHPDFSKTKFVYASTAFIRRGSKNEPISEDERRHINRLLRSKHDETLENNSLNLTGVKEETIMKKLSLVGSWDDSKESDKKTISKYLKMDYSLITDILKSMLKNNNDMVTYKNNIWKIKGKKAIIDEYAEYIHDDDIIEFQKIVIEVEKEPKYALSNDKRQFAELYMKSNKYSDDIRYSLMDTLLILKFNYDKLKNCKSTFKNIEYTLINNIIDLDDWKSIASSSDLFSYFAELCPESYLKFNERLLKKNDMIEKLIDESGYNFIKTNYMKELISGLKLTIQLDEYFINSCIIMIKLSEYDESIIDSLATVLLPWMPQTEADSHRRLVGIKNMYNHSRKMTLKLLKKLLPGRMSTTYEIQKFKYCYVYIYEFNKPTYTELYDEEYGIIEFCFKQQKNNIDFIVDIINDFPNINGWLFDYVVSNIKNSSMQLKDYNKKYLIWNSLKNYNLRVVQYKTEFSEEDKRKSDILNKLEKELFKIDYTYIRYFNEDEWTLEDEFEGNIAELKKKRIEITKEIFCQKGLKEVISFSKNLKNSFYLGYSLAELNILKTDEINIVLKELDNKNKNILSFASGFAKCYILSNPDFDIKMSIISLNNAQKTNLFLQMPNNLDTWKFVEKNLKFPGTYWKRNFVRSGNSLEEINYVAKKKYKYKLYNDAIDILYSGVHLKYDIDMDIAFDCLEGVITKQENIESIQYAIKVLITHMQSKHFNEDKMFEIEWSYMKLFDNECEPITIKKKIKENPQVFIELICLAYKKHNNPKKEISTVDETIALNAYYVLEKCKIIPGYDGKKLNKKEFNDWINNVVYLATKEDRLDITKFQIGKMLFYYPVQSKGLWIDRNIAAYINKEDNKRVREGFNNEAFNSIGVVNYSEIGSAYDSLANDYKNKAKQLESYSYDIFAKSILELSESLKSFAEHERDIY